MKKIVAFIMCVATACTACACGGSSNDTSSVAETAASPANGNSLSLFASSVASNATSSVISENESSVASSEITDRGESSVESYTSSSLGSAASSSKITASESKEKPKKVVTPISTQPNPTGIESVDRKSNNGKNWALTLVNPWNTLHTSYSVELGEVDARYSNATHYFDKRAVSYLNDMCAAAAEDGVQLVVISSYRTYDYQQMLYDNEIADYKSRNPGCSEKEAKIGAATVVARPATSEHNLGLAVDFNSVEESFENTKQFRWLQKHCTEYGFIMRYAKSKQAETGVIYEPWHYRYVGKENAAKIAASGLSLEEWLLQNNYYKAK